MNELGLLKEVVLAVIRRWRKDIREATVVIVPRELERTTSIVLFTFGGRPSFRCPTSLRIVTARVISAITAYFLNPIKGLRPKLSICWVSLASLLAPMGKH